MSAPAESPRPPARPRSRLIRFLVTAGAASALVLSTAGFTLWAFPTSVPVARAVAFLFGAEYLGRDGVRIQQGDEDCGIAALQMILEARGIPGEVLDSARAGVLERGEGASMLELSRLAEAQGVRVEGWRMNVRALSQAPLPAIVHLEDHFAVADRVGPRGVELRDPSLGRIRLSPEDFRDIWTGDVLVFPPADKRAGPAAAAAPASPASPPARR